MKESLMNILLSILLLITFYNFMMFLLIIGFPILTIWKVIFLGLIVEVLFVFTLRLEKKELGERN